MIKSYLCLFILLMALAGCKVQPDVAPREENHNQITNPFSYTPSQITLIQDTTALSLEGSLGFGYSYSITPTLPTGLGFNSYSGKILGTASQILPKTNFTVTATLGSEVYQTTISLEVKEAPPTGLHYPSSLISVQRGGSLLSYYPSVVGNVDSYTLSSVLPSGLNFNSTTGELSVIDSTNLVPQVLYLSLVAHNSGGEASFDFMLEIKDSAPTAINGLISNYIYIKGQNHSSPPTPITTPSYNVSYRISPALPNGLSLDTATGIISGTPTVAFNNTTFTLTAFNNEGETSTTFNIEVTDPVSGFAYESPVTLTNKTSMSTPVTPIYTGSAVFSVTSGTLPNGLTLNTNTGEILGVPDVLPGTLSLPLIDSSTVTITASVTGQLPQTADVTFNINYQPISFGYPETMTFIKDEAIVPQLPLASGEISLIDHYEIPDLLAVPVIHPLPTGLVFTSAGEISGTPTDAPTEGVYEIRAVHSSGYVLATQLITIKTIEKAPLNINYAPLDSNNNILSFNLGELQSEPLTYTGGEPTSYSIFPNLPNGLSFNTATGEIYGTATTPTSPRSYTVTGTNSAGSVSKTFQIEVKIGPPHGLAYVDHTFAIGDGSILAPSAGFAPDPSIVPTTFTVSPPLPEGLTINSLGEIKATSPLEITGPVDYTVTATNEAGSTPSNTDITIEIVNGTLGSNPFNYQEHYDPVLTTDVIVVYEGENTSLLPITPNYAALTGGKIINWTYSGSLPAGLSLNASTGEISGTPTTAPRELNPQYTSTNASTITIQGDNGLGNNHSETFKIIVLPKAPSFYLSNNYYIKPHGANSLIFDNTNGLTKNGGDTATTNNGTGHQGFNVSSTDFVANDSDYSLAHTDACGAPDIKYDLILTFENATGIQTTPITVLIADHPGEHTADRDFNGAGAVQTFPPTYECGTSSPPDTNYYFEGYYPPLLDLNPSTGSLSNNAGLLLKQGIDIKGERVSFSETLESDSSIIVETHFNSAEKITPLQYDFTNDGRTDILLYGASSLNLLEQKNAGAFSRHPATASVDSPDGLKSVTHFDATFGKGIAYVDDDGLKAFTTTTPLLKGSHSASSTDSFILKTGITGDYIHQLNTSTRVLKSFKLTKQTLVIPLPPSTTDYISFSEESSENLATVLTSPIDFKIFNINGDNISDYAIAHDSNKICIMEKVDEGTVPTSCTSTLSVATGRTIISMHLENLLGSQDLIVLSEDGTNYYVDVFENSQDSYASGTTPLSIITKAKASTTNPQLFFSDYRLDNMKDIFLKVDSSATSEIWMYEMKIDPITFTPDPITLNSSIFDQSAGSLLENNTYTVSPISLPDMGRDALFYCYQNTSFYCRIPSLIPDLRSN